MVKYGSRSFACSIVYTKRKTLEIAVHPDKSIVVRAPYGSSRELIDSKLKKRVRWISKKLDYFERFDPASKSDNYLSGSSFYYLGRQYRFKVIKSKETEAKLTRGTMYVRCPEPGNIFSVSDCVNFWLRNRAENLFAKSIEECMAKFDRKIAAKPELVIIKMASRWGSMSRKGRLALNIDLIRKPKECIDYVVTHELCHLLHYNHSKAYYKLLSRVMPDWERRKLRLEQ